MKRRETANLHLPRRRRRSIYVVPALFTTANIFAGFYAVVASLKGYQVLQSDLVLASTFFDNAAKAIGWAVLFDMLDGRIARMTNATSEFGVELDSLADLISFGLAPAVLGYAWGYGSGLAAYGAPFSGLSWAASFTFLVCGAFRLARFNVHSRRPIPESKKDRKQFVGLPIPAAAGLMAAIVHFVKTPILASAATPLEVLGLRLQREPLVWSLAFLLLAFCLAIMMISTVRYTSSKSLGFGNHSPRLTLLVLSLFVCGVYFYSEWVLLLLATSYAAHGILARGLSRILRHRQNDPSLQDAVTEEPG